MAITFDSVTQLKLHFSKALMITFRMIYILFDFADVQILNFFVFWKVLSSSTITVQRFIWQALMVSDL